VKVVERLDGRFTTSMRQELAREGTSAEFVAQGRSGAPALIDDVFIFPNFLPIPTESGYERRVTRGFTGTDERQICPQIFFVPNLISTATI
jgi:hypothetical protein